MPLPLPGEHEWRHTNPAFREILAGREDRRYSATSATGRHMRRISFISCLIFLASICISAQESDTAVKSKVIALEKLWNQAYKSGDTKALDSILDEGIVLVNDDGSMQTKTEFLASVKSPASASAQQQQVSPESFNVHVYGNVAIATGIMRVKGEEGGKPYSRRERFVDTWLYKQGNWVCVGTDATPVLH